MHKWTRPLAIAACAGLVGAGVVSGVANGSTPSSHHRRRHTVAHRAKRARASAVEAGNAEAPASVSQVPTALTGAGVDVNGQVVLAPLSASTTNSAVISFMSESEALADARSYANNPALSAGTPLLASLTLPQSIPPAGSTVPFHTVENVAAWITTFTAPSPVDVAEGGANAPALMMQHFSVAINAATGKFVVGFFTR